VNSTDRFFETVLVRPPADSYVNCVSTNPAKAEIDIALAKQQHRNYISILRESQLRVVELRPLEDFPDSVFMQDPAILGSCRSVICNFGECRRRGEERALLDDLGRLGIEVGEKCHVADPGTLEGGDVLITDHGIFVGESRRTNRSGIDQLSSHLAHFRVKAVRTEMLHLLCGCSYLSEKTMIIAPDLVSPELFPGFRFLTVPREEAYAADALYVGDRRVIVPSGFSKATSRLRERGYIPIEAEISEFYKGDGGVTCLCSPIFNLF